MRRWVWIAAGLVLLVGAVTALIVNYYHGRTIATVSGQADNIKVAQVGDFFVYIPLHYANDRGFFDRENIRITIINTGGDEKSVAAVINGDATFGIGDPTFAAIAGQKGQDVRVVASVVNGVPFWGLAKDQNVPAIVNPRQLAGLTVGTFPAPSTAYALSSANVSRRRIEPRNSAGPIWDLVAST